MDIISYALSKKIASSAVSGIKSMSVDGQTLKIVTNDEQILSMVFPTPSDGKDGVSISDIDVNESNQIVFKMSDGSEYISGTIPTVKGDKGLDGTTPTFTIGTVTTVDSTQSASVTITGTSANPVLNLTIPKGKDGSDEKLMDEKVKLTSSSTEAHYLEDLIDNSTIEIDTNNNCLVIKKIDGLSATVAEINFLSGVTSNIQSQINNLSKSMAMYGVFDTKADLLTSTDPTPVDGNTAIVIADEDNDDKQMTYIYIGSSSAWTPVAESAVLVRDFIVNPIDLSSETTGILQKDKIDTAIARLFDVLDKNTYKGSIDGVVKSADTLEGLKHTIDELNDTINNSHEHLNKSVLDNIISNGLGNRLLSDNGIYKEFLILSSTAPTDTYCIWVDTTLSSNPILKVNDGISWIAMSGGEKGNDGRSAYEVAVDNGFIGTETEWLNSLNGITPHIDETTNNWFIGDTDTGVLSIGKDGVDGRSVSSVTKDSENNIIVSFSDGTTQNIGKLSINIQGDFLTSNGFGNLRYYNGSFQYYDVSTSDWIDISITSENVYIINMIPQAMKKMLCVYDTELCKYKLKWQEPDDTIIDGQVACIVEKVVIRRKLNSVPIDENDGDLVIEINRKDFGSYKDNFFIDTDLSANSGDIYYYKAFPLSTTGFYNNSFENETNGVECKDYYLYGFKLNQNESDPASMITYLNDCDNVAFSSAYMDYTNDKFNYGDWEDVWFIKNLKPCMLKYDGTVDYELDKNDYSKKIDGTDSDIADDTYNGNVMIGIPLVYYKIVNDSEDTNIIRYYFSDKQIDSTYNTYFHLDSNGNIISYAYLPAYNGSLLDSKLRSVSGKSCGNDFTIQNAITYAKNNNQDSSDIWNLEDIGGRELITMLLTLIGKSTDSKTVFGNGNITYSTGDTTKALIKTGTMNNKGLFWGQIHQRNIMV